MSHPTNPEAIRPPKLGKKAFLLPAVFDAGNRPLHLWVKPETTRGVTVGYLLMAVTLPGSAEDITGVMDTGIVSDAQTFADSCFREVFEADSPSAFTILPSHRSAFGGLFCDDLQRLDALGVGA